jgi:hypothetical protein
MLLPTITLTTQKSKSFSGDTITKGLTGCKSLSWTLTPPLMVENEFKLKETFLITTTQQFIGFILATLKLCW